MASVSDMGARFGMLVWETIAKIRRAYSAQKKPVKATEFSYTRAAQLLPKIGPWRDELDGPLLVNEGKTPRERLTQCSPRLLRYTSGA